MTLVVNIITGEGMVIAADSRQCHRNLQGAVKICTDRVDKIFPLNSRVALSGAGLFFIKEGLWPKNIGAALEGFRRENEMEELTVAEIVQKIHQFFSDRYDWKEQLRIIQEAMVNDIRRQGYDIVRSDQQGIVARVYAQRSGQEGVISEFGCTVEKIGFLISGYNRDGSHEVQALTIPGGIEKRFSSADPSRQYGMTWIGQSDIAHRLIAGYDRKMLDMFFMADVGTKFGHDRILASLKTLEHQVELSVIPLADAVEFAYQLIRTTSYFQRFFAGFSMDHDVIPGVGGPVDIAVIRPHQGLTWIKKKQLQLEDSMINV